MALAGKPCRETRRSGPHAQAPLPWPELVLAAAVSAGAWSAFAYWAHALSNEIFALVHKAGDKIERANGLVPGWLPWTDRRMDLRDHQYLNLRGALPALCGAAAGSLLLRHAVQRAGDWLGWSAAVAVERRVRMYAAAVPRCACKIAVRRRRRRRRPCATAAARAARAGVWTCFGWPRARARVRPPHHHHFPPHNTPCRRRRAGVRQRRCDHGL